MRKIAKIIVIAFIVVSLAVPLMGCSGSSESEGTENQIATVQRGDLTVDITASGNLALSVMDDLAFEMAGTVAEILVGEGDSIKEGQVLAKLDTSEWEDQLTAMEREVLQAEINVINAEDALEKAQDSWLDSVSAGRTVRKLEQNLEWELEYDPDDTEKISELSEALDEAWEQFFRVASNSADARQVTVKETQLELAKAQLEDAREALDEVTNANPIISAPFDGFITQVMVEGGDEVKKGTVAVQLADPDKFEADILVSEMDIFQVTLGGEAQVQVDAMEGIISLPAEVTHISPTATIQQGVVNYTVKVKLQSLEAVIQEQQQAMQERREAMGEAGQGFASGEIPEQLRQAIEEGQMTQEQVEQMMEQMQQGQGMQQGQVSTAILEDFQLREGLTATVSVIVDERSDVLLVPNSAITTQRGQTYVQVVLADGTIEERAITTGISDWQYTEVTDGLSEGEQVVVPEGTATTTTTLQQQFGSREGGIFIPGMGGFGR
jgi:HlyD family secretion protein